MPDYVYFYHSSKKHIILINDTFFVRLAITVGN